MKTVLPISDIVNVIVNLSPRSAVRSGFNIALLLGDSEVVPLEERVRVYSSVESMLSDGFTTSMPEYQNALIYFAQSTRPGRVAIGRWDSENEDMVDAVKACRRANWDWYLCVPLSPTSADVAAIALFVEGCNPSTVLFYTTPLISTLTTLNGLNYRRSFGMYSELTPNLAVALAGWIMGANTGLAASAFTVAYKTLMGVPVDPLDENTVDAIKAVNGNYYVNRGKQYDGVEPGTMADGVWFDEIINIDMLVNDVELSIMDLLNTTRKVPQTEGGVLMIIASFSPALRRMVRIGFIAPGIWNAPPILDLNTGDALATGYLVQSEPVDEQAQSDRDQRIAPPIYIAIKLAGAIQYVTVQIDVNR